MTPGRGFSEDMRLAHVLADQADSISMERFKAQDLQVETKPDLTPVTDADRAKEVMAQIPSDVMAAYRPDVLGSVVIGHSDGAWTQVIYFTSEADARGGERKEPPTELRNAMEEMGKLSVGETTFLDLRQPLLQSAS